MRRRILEKARVCDMSTESDESNEFDFNKLVPAPEERWLVARRGSPDGAAEVVEVVQGPNSSNEVRVLRTVVGYVPLRDFLREVGD